MERETGFHEGIKFACDVIERASKSFEWSNRYSRNLYGGQVTLLENELVRKYFKAEACIHVPLSGTCDGCVALRILKAMQQPIQKGNRLLVIGTDSLIYETDAIKDHNGIHPFDLRLPDAFQKQEKECDGIATWKESHCPGCTAKQISRRCFEINRPPEKCFCGGSDMDGHIPTEGHDTHRPKDAVEEKIKYIRDGWANPFGTKAEFEAVLRDLVRLAKESVPECEGDH